MEKSVSAMTILQRAGASKVGFVTSRPKTSESAEERCLRRLTGKSH